MRSAGRIMKTKATSPIKKKPTRMATVKKQRETSVAEARFLIYCTTPRFAAWILPFVRRAICVSLKGRTF
jgi:hypothetical protein